jgi:2-C-methyl-D-erythritol 4-phosphate cytidylyltransferase
MHVTAVIPAAGYGRRLNKDIPKALFKIKGKPLLIHTLERISSHPFIKEIIVVANPAGLRLTESIIDYYGIRKVSCIVAGGRSRAESVARALKALSKKTDFVLVHDAARPFVSKKIISRAIQALKEAKTNAAVVVGVKVKDTIKKAKSRKSKTKVQNIFSIEKTLDRDGLWEIQTPQVFKKNLILKAYSRFNKMGVNDDASLVERLGVKVRIVQGSYFNIKITTPEDLVFAEAILNCRKFRFPQSV